VNKFMLVKTSDLFEGGDEQSLDQVHPRALGEYKALKEHDMKLYTALQENRLKEAHVIDFLDEPGETTHVLGEK
jgi:hypothetical protein